MQIRILTNELSGAGPTNNEPYTVLHLSDRSKGRHLIASLDWYMHYGHDMAQKALLEGK